MSNDICRLELFVTVQVAPSVQESFNCVLHDTSVMIIVHGYLTHNLIDRRAITFHVKDGGAIFHKSDGGK